MRYRYYWTQDYVYRQQGNQILVRWNYGVDTWDVPRVIGHETKLLTQVPDTLITILRLV